MKNLLLLLIISTTQINANLFEEFQQDLFKQSNTQQRSFVPLRQPSQIQLLGAGSISGILYETDSNELISNDAFLHATLTGREDFSNNWQHITTVDIVDSMFLFSDLADGEYYVSIGTYFQVDQAPRPLYMPTIWSEYGQQTEYPISDEQIITLVNGEARSDINILIEPAGILIITNNENQGVTLGNYLALDEQGKAFNGRPSVTNILIGNVFVSSTILSAFVPVGSYRFYVNSQRYRYDGLNFMDQIYGSGSCYKCKLELLSGKGQVINIAKFEKRVIDINLEPGASIAGKITFEEEEENTNNPVIQISPTNNSFPSETILLTEDSVDGEYLISGLVAGEYYLTFRKYGYVPIKDVLIRIATGQNITGIDKYLRKGTILKGSILDAESKEILIQDETLFNVNSTFEILDENLNVVESGYSYNNSNGVYSLYNGLKQGGYYIKTGSSQSSWSNKNYINQVYPDIECEGNICNFADAELIAVDSLGVIENLNFNLNRAFSISGNVQSLTNELAIKNIEIVVLNQTGGFVNVAKTQGDGNYKVGGLKAGDYYVRTYNGDKRHFSLESDKLNAPSAWVNQLYPDIDCVNDICALSEEQLVNIGEEDIIDIDFKLVQGTSISGQIKDRIANIGIPSIEIKIFTETGEYLESYFSDAYGYFTTAAIQPGSYKLVTSNQYYYVNQAYGGIDCGLKECNVSISETVTVAESNIENIDFNLLAGQDYYPELSGLWYNPEQSGHGLQVEVIKTNGTASLLVSWYVLHNGQPIWLSGTGPLNKDMAYVNLKITSGANFPPNFNASDVERIDWGLLKLSFSDMDNVEVSWQTDIQGFNNGSLPMQRLTNLSRHQNNDDSIDACFSGTFYNADESGHGVMIEVLGENADSMVATWFVYNEGEQFWLFASGTIQSNQATLSAIYTSGTNFPPNFDASQLQRNVWGELKVYKQDNNSLRLEWTPNSGNESFSSGIINMSRLTSIENINCET